MKRFVCALLGILSASIALAQDGSHPAEIQPAILVEGLGETHHPVSTTSVEAQRFFDQGLAFTYAFNHDEALRSFRRAGELDSSCAMAQWGIALSMGPDLNMDDDSGREKAACEAIRKARALAPKASREERAYIAALAARYSENPGADRNRLRSDYKNAMFALARKYPDDPDAATLYAESVIMAAPSRSLWDQDGKAVSPDTGKAIAALESVLRRDPRHVGANHYYIHAIEGSPNPERAFASAVRLPVLAPGAGHLVHMPAHIYLLIGDYEAAARSCEAAAVVDRAYIKSGATGSYPLMYYTHNLHFMAVAYGMEGRFSDAIKAAGELEAYAAPHIRDMPMLEDFMATSTFLLVRFHHWEEILNAPAAASATASQVAASRFARGMAFAATGKIEEAKKELQTLGREKKGSTVLDVAGNILAGKIALAEGNRTGAIKLLNKALRQEDSLPYTEPPGWQIPVRELLGGAFFSGGDYSAAENAFREDLVRHPGNGRSLFGLCESLKAQGKDFASQTVHEEFLRAWKNADVTLQISDF